MRHKAIAVETVAVLERGGYTTAAGVTVSIADTLRNCVDGTQLYMPDELQEIKERVLLQSQPHSLTAFELVNETTLQGSRRIVESGQYKRVAALNFASAKNPGGGFLGGAKAQEESLARSSGLYKSLLRCPAYYSFHRAQTTCLYSDRMIYSPQCPVLRLDNGDWLDTPYLVDFITSPAPNAGAIQSNEPENTPQILPTLKERSGKLLALAALKGCDALVLGAWGCGVFRNEPEQVASVFWEHLKPNGAFYGRFKKVLFSVFDVSIAKNTYQAFAERLASVIES